MLRNSLVADGTLDLRSSLSAEEGSASHAAAALRSSYSSAVPVYGDEEFSAVPKAANAPEALSEHAGTGTRVLNRRCGETHFYNYGREGEMGRAKAKPPASDATNARVGAHAFNNKTKGRAGSGVRAHGFRSGVDDDLRAAFARPAASSAPADAPTGGDAGPFSGAAGCVSTQIASEEPALRFVAPVDTPLDARPKVGSQDNCRAPQVERVVFAGVNTSRREQLDGKRAEDDAAGQSTHALGKGEPLLAGPGGPSAAHPATEGLYPGAVGPLFENAAPPATRQASDSKVRAQPRFRSSAGASTPEIALAEPWLKQEQPPKPPTEELFDRGAGLGTKSIALQDPLARCDAGVGKRRGGTHVPQFAEVVFDGRAAEHDNGLSASLSKGAAFSKGAGLDSHQRSVRDPYLVGDKVSLKPADASTTWKSQVDEILFGRDTDGSGSIEDVDAKLVSSPHFAGAAGVSSFRRAYEAPEHQVEWNTKLEGSDRIGKAKKKRAQPGEQGRHAEHLASKGLAHWMGNARAPDSAPGRDEEWKPGAFKGEWHYGGS